MAEFKTKGLGGRYTANVDPGGLCWECLGGALLGTITLLDGSVIGWAWRADGRSIDPHDRAFDLVDFPQASNLAETVAADG